MLMQTHTGFAWSVAFAGAVVLAIVALAKPEAWPRTRCCGSR